MIQLFCSLRKHEAAAWTSMSQARLAPHTAGLSHESLQDLHLCACDCRLTKAEGPGPALPSHPI